jgi:hypothetical protein
MISSPAVLYLGYGVSLAVASLGGAALLRDGVMLLGEPETSRRRRHAAALVRACAVLISMTSLFATGWLALTAALW